MAELEAIRVMLKSTMGADEWDLSLPVEVPIQAIITKIVKELSFRETDDPGNPIPYRLMWVEGNRYLKETETLKSADVEENNALVLTQEARAGNIY